MSPRYRPVTPAALGELVAERIVACPGRVRVAVDGAAGSGATALAQVLTESLPGQGRPAMHVRAEDFWRDASLRLEYGRHDALSYPGWLDAETLLREVLVPFTAHGRYLPSLRDPRTNRATREPVREAPPQAVLLVSGSLLLGRQLPFDLTVHLHLSAAALRRRTPAADAWTLPAYADYDARVRPDEVAGIVVRADDPRHLAVRVDDVG